MGIKIEDTREINLLDSINNENAINFKVGSKFIELTEDIKKTKGSPQLSFTRLSDNKIFYIKELFIANQGLVLNLDATDLKDGRPTTWVDKTNNHNNFILHNFAYTSNSGYNTLEHSLIGDGGNDYCLGPTNLNLGAGDFTIEIYFKKTSSSFIKYDTLLSKGTYGHRQHWYLYQYEKSSTHWNFRNDDRYNFEFYADANEKYCHLIIGRKNDTMFVRVNGITITPTNDSTSGKNVNLTNSEHLTIFSRGEGSERHLGAGVKFLRIYNNALTEKESQQNYQAITYIEANRS